MKNKLFFALTFSCFVVITTLTPMTAISHAESASDLEENNIEQKIKDLSDEWQRRFVEVVNDFLERELSRLQDEKEEVPQENLGHQIEKFQADVNRGTKDPETYFSLGRLYDQKEDGANAIISTKKAEEIFAERKDLKGVAEARRNLRHYFQKYDFQPEDFELTQ